MAYSCEMLPMNTETSNQTLLVPVANPETAERSLDTTIDIAHGQLMRNVLSHVVKVPPQVPLSSGDSLIDDDVEEERLLNAAVESRMRYARDVATGIVRAVEVRDTDAMLVGSVAEDVGRAAASSVILPRSTPKDEDV